MKVHFSHRRDQALNVLEVMVVLAGALLLSVCLLLPRQSVRNTPRIRCVTNLKQTSQAMLLWAGDHQGMLPMASFGNLTVAGGLSGGSNAFRIFQVLSNELGSPQVLVCPADRERTRATNFNHDFGNQKLSYFISLSAVTSNPSLLLAGDRHLTNGMPVKGGLLALDTNKVAGWTAKIHKGFGNIALTDGSVQQLNSSGLNRAVRDSGATNWLLFP